MGVKLLEAVHALRSHFPAQRQGDCGVFSFYYAAHLIQYMQGTLGQTVLSVDPPRKRYHALSPAQVAALPDPTQRIAFESATLTPKDRHVLNTSIRNFAKSSFASAQGEVFSAGEMQAIIDHYGYGFEVSATADADLRKAFIKEQVGRNRPVLIAYWCHDSGRPVATDIEPGAHWSVIFDKGGGSYNYINPWYPETGLEAPVADFLASNSHVDDMPYEPVWKKGPEIDSPGDPKDWGTRLKGHKYVATTQPAVLPGQAATHRPLYPGTRRQALANVIFSVFASPAQLRQMAPPVPARPGTGGPPPLPPRPGDPPPLPPRPGKA